MNNIPPPPVRFERSCRACRFGQLGVQGAPEHGLCRRRPPVVLLEVDRLRTNVVTAWPEVAAEDWCGEFAA